MKAFLGDGKLALFVTAILFALALFSALPDHAKEVAMLSDASAFVGEGERDIASIGRAGVTDESAAVRSAYVDNVTNDSDRLVLGAALHVRFGADGAAGDPVQRSQQTRDANVGSRLPADPASNRR